MVADWNVIFCTYLIRHLQLKLTNGRKLTQLPQFLCENGGNNGLVRSIFRVNDTQESKNICFMNLSLKCLRMAAVSKIDADRGHSTSYGLLKINITFLRFFNSIRYRICFTSIFSLYIQSVLVVEMRIYIRGICLSYR